jgi:hypothetical protein
MPYVSTRDDTQLFFIDGGSEKVMVFIASAWLDSRMRECQLPISLTEGSAALRTTESWASHCCRISSSNS